MNLVILRGNLTRDAVLLGNKENILAFSVAVNDSYFDKEAGESKEVVSFFDCKLFGPRAKKLAAYFTKGTNLIINGSLREDKYEKDGQEVKKVVVVVDEFEFGGQRKSDGKVSTTEKVGTAKVGSTKPKTKDEDEDIPF